jgi:hypothetical protein
MKNINLKINNMETKIRAFSNGKMMFKDIFDLNWYATEKNTETGCNTLRKMIPDDRSLKVMGFTGKQDKNGKNIYAGDFDQNGDVVIWCKECSAWQLGAYDFPTNDLMFCHCCDGNFMFNDCFPNFEIMGNIYEN